VIGSMKEEKILDIRAQLEEELTWRQDELRLLRNQLSYIESEDDKRRFRKALLVMLYSHYEGFCNIAFQIYISAINDEALKRTDVNTHLAALSLSKVFDAYENKDIKPEHYKKIFKRKLPEERKLHRFARQIDFVENLNDFWNQTVVIPEDIVDTESNLWPVVLQKLLYRLGLPHDYFKDQEKDIFYLLNLRNGISHGRNKEGLDERLYQSIEKATIHIMENIIHLIIDALRNKSFLAIHNKIY